MDELIVLEHPARVEKRRPRPARQELSVWRLPWLQQIPPRQVVQRVWMRQAAPSPQVELPNGPVNLHKWGPKPVSARRTAMPAGATFPAFLAFGFRGGIGLETDSKDKHHLDCQEDTYRCSEPRQIPP